MSMAQEVAAIARLDAGEVLRSRWLLAAGVVYALLAAVFVLVGLRESTLLGFTGVGRVLLSFCHALVLILPLLALAATGQVVNRAREDGSLELFFSHPLSRSSYFLAVTLTRFAMLLGPLVVLVVGLAVVGGAMAGEQVPWAFVGRALAVSAALLWAFTGAGLLVTTLIRNQARALLYGLLLWASAVSLLDFALIGAMLRWKLRAEAVFVLASLNPVQAARVALLSGIDRELSTLGPVGFYLANQVSGAALVALGLGWPLVIGTVCWVFAGRSFGRTDLV